MTDECKIPSPLGNNPTEFQKLQAMGERQKFILCKIQSAQKVLEALNVEISRDSELAGILVRDMVRQFRELEMRYLGDSRAAISKQSNKVSLADILAEPDKDRVLTILCFTTEEGGEWQKFKDMVISIPTRMLVPKAKLMVNGNYAHSIRFSDGTEWDIVNGIRPKDD